MSKSIVDHDPGEYTVLLSSDAIELVKSMSHQKGGGRLKAYHM